MRQVTDAEGVTEYTFDSTAERDRYIDEHFPKRKMQDAPGTYLLPDGSELQVHMESVWHYPAP